MVATLALTLIPKAADADQLNEKHLRLAFELSQRATEILGHHGSEWVDRGRTHDKDVVPRRLGAY